MSDQRPGDRILFIGGPLDGQQLAVPPGFYVRVPGHPGFRYFAVVVEIAPGTFDHAYEWHEGSWVRPGLQALLDAAGTAR